VTRRAAVLGQPISHSLSPVLHGAAYEALGLSDWRYDRQECDEEGLAGLVAGLGPDWAGLSLTMPLKRRAVEIADEVSPLVDLAGAANTLIPVDREGARRWRAENTDVLGMVDALSQGGVVGFESPVIVGAGGTAQATLVAFHRMGKTTVTAVVRDLARANELRQTAERAGVALAVRSWDDAREVCAAAQVIVSTVPAEAGLAVAALLFPPGEPRVTPPCVVMDVGYHPWPTPLALATVAEGCRVISGRELLLHQAVHQVELMTGRKAPVAAMRAALDAAT
jgi:shikimate dehydrogenase